MPYDKGNCGTQPEHFVEVGKCEQSELIPKNANIFPNKVFDLKWNVVRFDQLYLWILYINFQVPLNLNRCPIRIATFAGLPFIGPPKNVNMKSTADDVPNANLTDGFEVILIKTIADKLNLKTKF